MTRTAKVAVGLIALVLAARLVATALETMAVSSGAVRIVVVAMLAAGALAGVVYVLRRTQGDH